jgi:hypothetical protein
MMYRCGSFLRILAVRSRGGTLAGYVTHWNAGLHKGVAAGHPSALKGQASIHIHDRGYLVYLVILLFAVTVS